MAPSVEHITRLLMSNMASHITQEKQSPDTEGLIRVGDLDQAFSDDIDFQINGLDLTRHAKGIYRVNTKGLSPGTPALGIEPSKPINGEVVRVIGGGNSQWAAAVLKSATMTTKNKTLNHEWVATMQFNDKDEICAFKVYSDALHLHSAMAEI